MLRKISKTTPCKVAGARRQGRFGPILDTSGKSAALLHHRTIRQTPVGAPWRAVRCDVGRKSLPRLKLHWLVKLQWLLKLQWPAAARDRLRIAEPPRFRRACRWHAAQLSFCGRAVALDPNLVIARLWAGWAQLSRQSRRGDRAILGSHSLESDRPPLVPAPNRDGQRSFLCRAKKVCPGPRAPSSASQIFPARSEY